MQVRRGTEWELTDDGKWRLVDSADELLRLSVAVRELTSRNRERIAASRALCANVKMLLRQRWAWRASNVSATVQ
jgi:hypothetical protein